jgi:hypothetical protein
MFLFKRKIWSIIRPMPIVTIHSSRRPTRPTHTISQIQCRGAEALGGSRDNIWVQFVEVVSGVERPIVFIDANEGRPIEIKRAFMKVIAEILEPEFGTAPWIYFRDLNPMAIY